MPGPIFNMVLMLDNDFAAVRSCFTDHLFCAPGYAESKQGRVGFVPLDGLDGAIDVQAWAQGPQAQDDRRLICQKRNGLGFLRPKVRAAVGSGVAALMVLVVSSET
jgi:hypothetical protein